MLELKLRDEFLNEQIPGTAIALRKSDNTGAAQQAPDHILSITYPTADVRTALKEISVKRSGRPVVLMGDRGRGKSHILAVMHHAISAPARVESWGKGWGDRLNENILKEYQAATGFVAITEPVQNHEYPFLWDLIFERHPRGVYYRGKFDNIGQYFPPRSLLEEMFKDQPTALILDEFQTWFDGLPKEDKQHRKPRQWAFSFTQVLSELAADHPEYFMLVVSVLNNSTDAFQQIHRNNPAIVDFTGPTAKQDRQKMLLHRLFQNRDNIPTADIQKAVMIYGNERFKLLFPYKTEAERGNITVEVMDTWPFTPELIDLLEGHILMSSAAQEERDMIRILAEVYRARGDTMPLITPADFYVDEDSCGVQSLIDSIATHGQHDKLREIAIRNLDSIRTTSAAIPHARELLSAIWMRSLSPDPEAGATRQELRLDITKDEPIDANAFQNELMLLTENSINIHGEETPEGRLRLGLHENPRSKVRSTAKNHKLWRAGTGALDPGGQASYPGKDIDHIRKTMKAILVPETRQPASRIIVLGPNWESDPWPEVEEADRPDRWDRPMLLIIPAQIQNNSKSIDATLGQWLKTHVQKRRNTVRFLLLSAGAKGIYEDDEVIFSARCSHLTSKEAWGKDQKYWNLHQGFDKPLRDALKVRFDRFAVLREWNYQNPDKCIFDPEKIGAVGGEIPMAIENKLKTVLFDLEHFRSIVLDRAKDNYLVGDLLDELADPPPPGAGEAIPFLGDTVTYEKVLEIAAKGEIALKVSGSPVCRLPEHESDEQALSHIRQKAFRSGKELREIKLGLPGQVGGPTIVAQPPSQPPGTVPIPPPDQGPIGQPSGSPDPGTVPTPFEPTPLSTPGPALTMTQKTSEPNTTVNLIGSFEKWGIASHKTLKAARIEFNDLTVQQVKQILQRIPSAFKASMEIEYTEGEDE